MSALRNTASPEALDFLKASLDTYRFDSEVMKETILAISVTQGTKALDILIGELRNNSKFSIARRFHSNILKAFSSVLKAGCRNTRFMTPYSRPSSVLSRFWTKRSATPVFPHLLSNPGFQVKSL